MSAEVITKPKVEIEADLLKKLKAQTQEMGQVVIHCLYQDILPWGSAIRIWPSTYLFDCHSEHRSELIHAENITMYPEWTSCDPFNKVHFTLIFSGLPSSCSMFNLEEFCNNSGGEFVCHNIPRNESDVYYLMIN